MGYKDMNGSATNKGQGFDKNKENINKKGRPKTLESALLEAGYDPYKLPIDIMKFLSLTKTQFKKMAVKSTLCTSDMLILKVIDKGLKSGNIDIIWDLLDRALPKQTSQKIEHSGEVKQKIDISKYTDEEKQVLLKLARKNEYQQRTPGSGTGRA
jgi:hypothetical protein